MIERKTRSSLSGGILLILLGVFFLIYQLAPSLFPWFAMEWGWPLIVIGVGLFLLVFGLVIGEPGMAVPACIVGGIGGILYYQNLTGDFASWAYIWTLIPGFVGIGTILAGLLGSGRLRDALEGGFWLVIISGILFMIFGSFLGGLQLLGSYWPALLIVLGVLILVRGMFRR